MARRKPQDLTVLAASTHAAIIAGWELQSKREVARSKAPMRLDMSKQRMRVSGGNFVAGPNTPRDQLGMPIAGA